MKKLIVLVLAGLIAVTPLAAVSSGAAFAEEGSAPVVITTQTAKIAKEGMMAYVGTRAFTRLTAEERQACAGWLSDSAGGVMNEACRKATMRLVAIAPDAVSDEQRQALVAAATADYIVEESSGTVANAPSVPNTPVVIEKKGDTTGAAIAGGLVGLVTGLIIGNNSGRSHWRGYYPPGPPPGRGPVGPAPRMPGRVPMGRGPQPGGPGAPRAPRPGGGPGGPRR